MAWEKKIWNKYEKQETKINERQTISKIIMKWEEKKQ